MENVFVDNLILDNFKLEIKIEIIIRGIKKRKFEEEKC